MPSRGGSLSRVDRNASERDRRLHMKELYSRLAFLLPAPPAMPSIPGLLDHSVIHVKQLEQRVELLKKKKQLLEASRTDNNQTAGGKSGSSSPALTVRERDSVIQVDLRSGSNEKFSLRQVIQVLQEEAAQVVAISYSNLGDAAFCTIKAQAVSARIGVEATRVYERLKELIP